MEGVDSLDPGAVVSDSLSDDRLWGGKRDSSECLPSASELSEYLLCMLSDGGWKCWVDLLASGFKTDDASFADVKTEHLSIRKNKHHNNCGSQQTLSSCGQVHVSFLIPELWDITCKIPELESVF